LGKGVRTAARDAILSDESTKETKGKIFGFHRSMDTFGAVLGPLVALTYLYFFPGDYIKLFYIAFIPSLLSVVVTFLVKDKKSEVKTKKERVGFLTFMNYWKTAPADYRKLLFGLLAFTLFNSSDVFLLLKAKESGLSDTMVIVVYVFYNLIYALFALPVGILADKFSLKTVYVFGLFLFTIVYFGMSVSTNLYLTLAMFFIYGIYSASTEGISKAWITNIADKKDTATAIGLYTGLQSVFTMLASSVTGLVWFNYGGFEAFIVTAGMTLLVAFYIISTVPKPAK
jgi:MFS family permease